MATKKPLCNYGGKVKELQTGDSVGGGGGAANFTDLGDVPASYTGAALKSVRVNAGETGLEFAVISGGGSLSGTFDLDGGSATVAGIFDLDGGAA